MVSTRRVIYIDVSDELTLFARYACSALKKPFILLGLLPRVTVYFRIPAADAKDRHRCLPKLLKL